MSTADTRTPGGVPAGPGLVPGRALRTRTKVLPEHARGHNRSLVLQTLYREGPRSRADLARETGLTRVTVSDLVAELMGEGLIVDIGPRGGTRPGKPATLLDIHREAYQIIGIDLSEHHAFRGALLDLDGEILKRAERPLDGATGEAALEKVLEITEELIALATAPVLGIGIGSPGIVDLAGIVQSAPNLGWTGLEVQRRVAERAGIPVVVANDANVAALAEHGFGGALGDMMLVKIGHGVGAGMLLGGTPLFGSRFASGEIGHVVVGTDGGAECVCGKHGCLETWLAAPRLAAALEDAADDAARDDILRQAGRRLGIALAPIVGALDLAEIVLSGPEALLDGSLAEATLETLRERTMAEFHGHVALRMTELGTDIVMRGAAVMVLSGRLGVS
ncbi:ROK family transcriptional regulator [Homoserinibacter sp. YIM 151385]|uniref:ROK family transcriptional regulator n=1 Tax=Homoserinibacter sp. YIM 151385 TaxID=2985506 RepID=UPI0022F1313A|nr:ROK family transcriptional regulator [Homoserinibacter sp. YIM 151385]WBU36775.1 ROK family transcriptional regulator [Homoserinibacter sp. YIM 151385]